MKATTNEQQSLLKLAALELDLNKVRAQIRQIESGSDLEALRAQSRATSETFLSIQTEFENLGLEIQRVATDLELVEARLARDKQRLGTLGSAREAAAVEAEISALAARKNALETSELEFLETRSELEQTIVQSKADRDAIAKKMAEVEAQLQVEVTKLQATGSTIETQMHQVRAGINVAVIEAYDRKSTRALAVGKVTDQSCGACGLMLTPTALAAILASPADEMPSCPNCEAFLVR